MKIINETRQTLFGGNIRVADSFFGQLIGLLPMKGDLSNFTAAWATCTNAGLR